MDFCSATYQMSAIATKKAGGEVATQLTFPAVFQDVYASQHRPLAYAPPSPFPIRVPMAGDDFQSHYHAQKKKDADYMANAKVIATRNARRRMLVSHQNYYGMPAPALAQREFANGSAGALILNSARRDGTTAPFQLVESAVTGGVLRTAEGQAYGKARLLARVRQLDAIDAEKAAFEGVAPPSAEAPLAPGVSAIAPATAPVSQNARIELQLLLQSIIDALMGERNIAEQGMPGEKDELSRFTFGDSIRALALIVRVASSPDTDAETMEDVLAPVDNIVNLLEGLTDPDRLEQQEVTAMGIERLITTRELFGRLREYLTKMMEGINLSPRERQALSKNLVSTLGFAKFTRQIENAKVESRALYERIARGRLFDARGRQAMDDEDDDDDDDDFDAPATPREDTEQGSRGPRSAFTEDDRQRFGYGAGDWFDAPPQGGREAPAFLGEDRPPLPVLGMVEEPPVPRATPSVRSRASNAPSAEIRGVYDPVLGARGVEVLRPASVRSRPASARSVGRVRETFRVRNVGTPAASRVPGSRRVFAQGREVPPPPSVTPTRTERRPAPSRAPTRRSSARGEVAGPSAAGGLPPLPSRQAELPTSREGFVALAERINQSGGLDGKPIRVYSSGTLESIRRNFIRRLGLQGKP